MTNENELRLAADGAINIAQIVKRLGKRSGGRTRWLVRRALRKYGIAVPEPVCKPHVFTVWSRKAGGDSVSALAREYGVSRPTIRNWIKRGKDYYRTGPGAGIIKRMLKENENG